MYEKLTAPASKDNPRSLRKKGSDTVVTVTDAGEYLSMTSALGYLDVTDGDPDAETASKSGGSGSGSGSGAAKSGAKSSSGASGSGSGSGAEGSA